MPSIYASFVFLNNVDGIENKLRLFADSNSFDIIKKDEKCQNIWRQWTMNILNTMKKDEIINDVLLLMKVTPSSNRL